MLSKALEYEGAWIFRSSVRLSAKLRASRSIGRIRRHNPLVMFNFTSTTQFPFGPPLGLPARSLAMHPAPDRDVGLGGPIIAGSTEDAAVRCPKPELRIPA